MTEHFQEEDLAAAFAPKGERSNKRADRIQALAVLYATPRSSRAAAGLPLTDKAFADIWGVHPNQIGKDKKTEDYAKALEVEKEKRARMVDPRGTAAFAAADRESAANDDLSTYQALKGQLSMEAMAGDSKSLELWMKLFGQPYIVEETTRVDAVSNLDDRELVEAIIELVEPSLLISILKDRGLI